MSCVDRTGDVSSSRYPSWAICNPPGIAVAAAGGSVCPCPAAAGRETGPASLPTPHDAANSSTRPRPKRASFTGGLGADQAGNRIRCLLHLRVGLLATAHGGVDDARGQVLAEQLQRECLQSLGG